MNRTQLEIPLRQAEQQPPWEDSAEVARVRAELSSKPPLVSPHEVDQLRTELAEVACGRMQVVQAGDCAEDPAECTNDDIARKTALLDVLAGVLKMRTRKPVLRVGRIAGQFAKPRSASTERSGGADLPVYRGHLVNSPEPDLRARRPDPWRMLDCYHSASETMRHLGWGLAELRRRVEPPVWTSHEALLLDYEVPLLRAGEQGRPLLTSTHWPWIGERTRSLDGAHVALLARVSNPVACKIGPEMTVDNLLSLCERLDPEREPGRLTFIVRVGADLVEKILPPLVLAARSAGHPVIWLTDPMHANTVGLHDGMKTRYVDTLIREVLGFQSAVRAAGGIPGGLHLETTPDDVVECVTNSSESTHVGDKYTSLCDPRLNPSQAQMVVSAWNS